MSEMVLRDDDSPGNFKPRRITIVRRVKIADRHGAFVKIEPELDLELGSGPLRFAVLIPRRTSGTIDDILAGEMTEDAKSVLVYRVKDDSKLEQEEYTADDLTLDLWGEVLNRRQ